jgi:hypothetical protein
MTNIKSNLRKVAAIAACLAVITMFVSCEKDDPKDKVKLLDTETSGLFHKRKFLYDEQNRIKEVWRFSGEELMDKAIFTYTGDDLTKIEDPLYGENPTYFVKNGNTISWTTSVEIIEGEELGNQNLNNTITLNNDGLIEKWEGVLLGFSSVVNYTWVNGNCTKQMSVSEGYGSVETREINLTYGAYRSAFSGCNTPKWIKQLRLGGANYNVMTKSENEYIDAMGYKLVFSTTSEYVYDSDGFPTRSTQKYHGDYAHLPDEITEYKYIN